MPGEMGKTLIIGMATGYDAATLAPFLTSLKMTGYEGRTILISEKSIPGVEVIYPPFPLLEHPFRARHPIIIPYLDDDYCYVMTVDTKDIVFQQNPMEWVDKEIDIHDVIVAGEGITFKQSKVWGRRLLEAFPQEYFRMQDMEIVSGAVVAGRPRAVRALLAETYALCQHAKGDEDETALNVALRRNPTKVRFCVTGNGFVSNYNQTGSEIRDHVIYPSGSSTPFCMWHQHQYHGLEILGDRYTEGFTSHSQANQDIYVWKTLKDKTNGTFLDIGCQKPVENSNTYELERLGWRGLLVDINPEMIQLCREQRTSHVMQADATKIENWSMVCEAAGLGKVIDYLSLDIDDQPDDLEKTTTVLTRLLDAGYGFRVITCEHDRYRLGDYVRNRVREILRPRGYIITRADVYCGEPQYVFEDWWVNTNLDGVP